MLAQNESRPKRFFIDFALQIIDDMSFETGGGVCSQEGLRDVFVFYFLL